MIRSLLKSQLGKRRWQKIYESMFRIALEGMNYGNGGDFKISGELSVLKYIQQQYKDEKSLTIFDVGGNIGEYSKTVSDFFNGKAVIHSFEPSKKAFEVLLNTISGRTNIIPNNVGLSDTEKEV